jgi:VanZ family protein
MALLVVNILFIWSNSMLPGEVSGNISRWVKELLSFAGGAESEQGHGLLRKLGHFTEFSCLGLWLAWLSGMLKKHPLIGLAGGFLVACVDETIQRFVPDRGPSFFDVLIDTAGVSVGIILLFVGHAVFSNRKKKILPTEE